MNRRGNSFFIQTQQLCVVLGLVILSMPLAALAQESQPATKRWPTPKKLIEQLDELGQRSPMLKSWVANTKQLVTVITDGGHDAQQRQANLEQLIKQRDQLQMLATQVWNARKQIDEAQMLSIDISRMHYRLSRRIDIWTVALKMPVRSNVSDNATAAQVGYRKLNFDSLQPAWVDYLLLDEFQTAFEGLNSDEDLKRETARRMLARIYSPALLPAQREYAQNIFDENVLRFLKSHASDPVDPADLLARLEYYEAEPSARASHYLNQSYQDLLWSTEPLDRTAAGLLDAHYRNANFRLTVSQRFMNRLLPTLPTMAEPVSEQLNGHQVSGRSQITNQINVHLVPDANRLNFQIETQGEVLSDTMLRTKSVRIFNHGLAWFNVTKPITVDRNGIDATQKAFSTSRSQQVLVDIKSNVDNVPLIGNFVRRIAENRVREDSPEANQIFRRKVANQAEERVESVLSESISKVEQNAEKNLLQPLLDLNLDPEPLQLATTADKIIIRYRLAGRDQMAANTSRPQDAPKSLMNIQLHHSLLNNAIARIGLNGNQFNNEELAAHLQDVLGIAPQPSAGDDKGRDAAFTFAKHDPVKIEFVEDHINVTLNLSKLELSKSKSLRNISMTASYEIATNGMYVRLLQDDNGTRIKGTGRKKLRLGDRAAISTVMKVLFRQQYDFHSLPKQFREHDQARQLTISNLVLSDGWIGVSIDDAQPEQPTRIIDRLPQRFGSLRNVFK
ncbi:MAG: hypothetical protein AAFN77_08240 [Planctomycetota bacterium]